jgi:hypothetical protein
MSLKAMFQSNSQPKVTVPTRMAEEKNNSNSSDSDDEM